MNKIRKQIFNELETERAYQDSKWGDEFDDKNTPNDWITYIVRYLGNAVFTVEFNKQDFRKGLLKSAALCIAAIEALERNDGMPKRHYDEEVLD